TCRVGKWMVKCSSLLQCSCWILVSRGTWESDLLGCAWCGRDRSYCPLKKQPRKFKTAHYPRPSGNEKGMANHRTVSRVQYLRRRVTQSLNIQRDIGRGDRI